MRAIDDYYTERTERQLSEADGCFSFIFRLYRYAFLILAIVCFFGGFQNSSQWFLSAICLFVFFLLFIKEKCEKVNKAK